MKKHFVIYILIFLASCGGSYVIGARQGRLETVEIVLKKHSNALNYATEAIESSIKRPERMTADAHLQRWQGLMEVVVLDIAILQNFLTDHGRTGDVKTSERASRGIHLLGESRKWDGEVLKQDFNRAAKHPLGAAGLSDRQIVKDFAEKYHNPETWE